MNKTIFNLDIKTSIVIMAIVGVFFSFLSNAYFVNGIVDFIFYVIKLLLFVAVFIIIYSGEKNNKEFKETNKRMIGYISLSSILNIIFSLFITTHILEGMFITFSGITCFWLILSFVLELVNALIDSPFIKKIFNINEKIGLTISNPIVKLVEKTITND